jgi:hypothetical protein
MPAPSPQPNSTKYAIRKSQSVGGFSPSGNNKNKVKTKETPSLKTKSNHQTPAIITENDTENDATPVGSPEATPITGRKIKTGGSKKLGNLFKWFRNNTTDDANDTTQNSSKNENEDLYAKIKKNQALRVLERSIFSNGTDVSQGGPIKSALKRNESVESICSVGSTASFSYVPISNKKNEIKNKLNKQNKIIPLGKEIVVKEWH